MSKKPNSPDVAQWMLKAFEVDGYLDQSVAIEGIRQQFGEEFVVQNASGSSGISPAVLAAFRKLTSDDVVWSRSALAWRRREDHDLEGRMQP